jgi:hypothetical protein
VLAAPANLLLAAFTRAHPFFASIPVQPINRPYQQLGRSHLGGTKDLRESITFRICGVVPARALRTTKQQHKPNNRSEGFRGRKGSSVMTTSRKSTLISAFATLLSLVVLARPSAAQSYNAAGDFSIGSNPNRAWSYGWSTNLASGFIPDTISSNNYIGSSLIGWLGNQHAGDGVPTVLKNPTASPITLVSTTFQPGQLALDPGFSGQDALIRWTAPSSGTFSINATFSGLSALGDTADVHILHNGVSFFDAAVVGSPSPATYSGLQSITAGDTITFAVGFGSNGNYNEDITGLSASIVPEPATLGLVGMGLACLLSFRFLKRK